MRTVNCYPFTAKTLNKLLKSRVYVGEYSYAGFVVTDGMPRIIDDATFEEVQKSLRSTSVGVLRRRPSWLIMAMTRLTTG